MSELGTIDSNLRPSAIRTLRAFAHIGRACPHNKRRIAALTRRLRILSLSLFVFTVSVVAVMDVRIGETGFEPAALCSQNRCSTRLSYSPRPITLLFCFDCGCKFYWGCNRSKIYGIWVVPAENNRAIILILFSEYAYAVFTCFGTGWTDRL